MELLRDMALFVEVARARSFTKAAARLEMPISSLSRRINKLEADLRMKLFRRTTRSVLLTEAGESYFQRCAAIVDEARVAHEDLKEVSTAPRGSLRIAMGPMFLVPYLVAFRRLYPEITFDLDMNPQLVDLSREPFDLALRIGRLEDSSLVARQLTLLTVGLYASPAYLKSHGTPKRPEDLPKHDTIAGPHGMRDGRWTLSNGREDRRVPHRSPFTANGMWMIRALTLAGAGIGVLDEAMVKDDVQLKRLVRVLPQWSLDRVPVHAVTASRLVPAKTRLLVDFLIQQLAPTGK